MTDDSQQNLSIYTQLRMSNTKIKSLTTIQYNDFLFSYIKIIIIKKKKKKKTIEIQQQQKKRKKNVVEVSELAESIHLLFFFFLDSIHI